MIKRSMATTTTTTKDKNTHTHKKKDQWLPGAGVRRDEKVSTEDF